MSQCLLFSTGNQLKLLQFCSNSILFKQIVCKILIFKTPFMASCLLITVLSVREMSQRSKNSLKIRGNSYNARTFQKYNDKVERTILFRQIHAGIIFLKKAAARTGRRWIILVEGTPKKWNLFQLRKSPECTRPAW